MATELHGDPVPSENRDRNPPLISRFPQFLVVSGVESHHYLFFVAGNEMHALRTNRADMMMKACLVALGLVVVTLLVGAQPASGRQAADGQYSITDLGTLPGGYESIAYGINNRGQVVGYSTTASGEYHAFLWEDGEMTDLGTLGGAYSVAYGINSRGQVVGYSASASGENHAVLWSK
jgi:probable HAF family extracellular repeat protein